MYSLSGYGRMLADRLRMDAHIRALRAAVQPGSIVIDLGAGPGVFAQLACEFGAKRVYAIEPADAILLGKRLAALNGFSARIEFLQALSTEIALPDKADVLIADLRGILPFLASNIPSIVDARQRLLRPGGFLIPQSDTIWASVVEAPEIYDQQIGIWGDSAFGLNLRTGRDFLVNNFRKARFESAQLLARPSMCGAIDYRTVEDPNFGATPSWVAERAGTAHGLAVWFDATLADGIQFSNSPASPELIYGNAFFPWTHPVAIEAGDRISVELRADLVGDDYVWSWKSLVQPKTDGAPVKFEASQSTFFGAPLSADRLRATAPGARPTLNEAGEIDRQILAMMNGELSLDQIAERLHERFPARFPNAATALSHASALASRYSGARA